MAPADKLVAIDVVRALIITALGKDERVGASLGYGKDGKLVGLKRGGI